MRNKLKARIEWLTEEQGGRKTIPWSEKYAPVAIIKGESFDFQDSFWSLIVNNIESVSEYETIAEIHYLFDSAPDNLYKGIEFGLYEGTKLVANGIVLPENDF